MDRTNLDKGGGKKTGFSLILIMLLHLSVYVTNTPLFGQKPQLTIRIGAAQIYYKMPSASKPLNQF